MSPMAGYLLVSMKGPADQIPVGTPPIPRTNNHTGAGEGRESPDLSSALPEDFELARRAELFRRIKGGKIGRK